MLESVLKHLNNWFVVPGGIHEGVFEIKNATINLPFLQHGQYYRICGSVLNDGLRRYGYVGGELLDETFTGTVWALAIPNALVELSNDIDLWIIKNRDVASSPYTSESFGGYSYTKAAGAPLTWEAVFRSQLNPYRKLKETAPVKPVKPWGVRRGTC